jgi:hypothetical protein
VNRVTKDELPVTVPPLRAVVKDTESGMVGTVVDYGLHFGASPTTVCVRDAKTGLEWRAPVERVIVLSRWSSGGCGQ